MQRYLITTTGHLYSGQWNGLYSQKEMGMGWAPIGQTADLLEVMLLALLQMVTGMTFTQATFASYLPIGLVFIFPLFFYGLYKRFSV